MTTSRIPPPDLPKKAWDGLYAGFKALPPAEREHVRVMAVNQGRYILDQFRVSLQQTADGGERQTEGRPCHLRRP